MNLSVSIWWSLGEQLWYSEGRLGTTAEATFKVINKANANTPPRPNEKCYTQAAWLSFFCQLICKHWFTITSSKLDSFNNMKITIFVLCVIQTTCSIETVLYDIVSSWKNACEGDVLLDCSHIVFIRVWLWIAQILIIAGCHDIIIWKSIAAFYVLIYSPIKRPV